MTSNTTSWFRPQQCIQAISSTGGIYTFGFCFGKIEQFILSFIVICLLVFLLVINCKEKGCCNKKTMLLPEISALSLCILFEWSVFIRYFLSSGAQPAWLYTTWLITENIT